MAHAIHIWLVARPHEAEAAGALSVPTAWLIYRCAASGGLQRAQTAVPQGGLMGLMGPLPESADLGRLAWEISAECGRRGFRGLLLDLETTAARAVALIELMARRSMPCYAPLSLAGAPAGARALIPSALSGGSFDEMLAAAISRYGDNLGLELTRMCHDFSMPAYPPQGTALTAAQFRAITETHRPTPFFSDEMQCRYFTYPAEDGPHFVLFDDLSAARGKIARAERAGFRDVFASYGQWGQSAAELFV